MNTNLLIALISVATLGGAPFARGDSPTVPPPSVTLAERTFALSGARSREPQEYTLETRIVSFAPDGGRGVTDFYRLRLKCTPAAAGSSAGDTFTCLGFAVQFGSSIETDIPALKGMTYVFDLGPANERRDGPILGVPHEPFEKLIDATGRSVPPVNAYHLYNAFVDFHTFCSIFPHPMGDGAGIEDLPVVGRKILHASAFSGPSVNLGSSVADGSFFKNGEVTLEFKGLGVVGGAECALLGVDSGRSSFAMTVRPMPELEVKTTGSSHYKGDIYLNLATQWVSRVDADETVVTETTLPMPPNKVNTVIERTILIQNVSARPLKSVD